MRLDAPAGTAPSIPLAFDRTINRTLVHRRAVAEVFLTDLNVIDDRSVSIGAQLPRDHRYYNDHRYGASYLDPLLLLEVSRQATLASAHALGVPEDSILISQEYGIEMLASVRALDETNLQIDSVFEWEDVRRGIARSGACRQRLFAGGREIATHWSRGRILSRTQMLSLRAAQRGQAPPLTNQMPPRSDRHLADPRTVERYNPINVVISAPVRSGLDATATIVSPWDNGALFDHSYDHLTMQLLTEAGRQVGTVLAGDSEFENISAVYGRFHRFAEIDAPATVTATHVAPGPSTRSTRVVIEQSGERLGEVEFTASTPPGQP